MPTTLTNLDYCLAAKDLGCEVAALLAVAEVESSGGGYDEKGRIKVRFEGHKFREYTFGKYDRSHPHLSYPYKYQKSKPHGYLAFNEAFALDEESALKASSFGKFQPLAVNYREAGFTNVRAFVDFLRVSEKNQLTVFCLMVKFRHLDNELRRKDWAGFARGYNGASYRDNNYDVKMRNADKRYSSLNINCGKLLAESEIDNLLNNFDEQPTVQIGKPTETPAEIPANSLPAPQTDSQSPSADNPASQPASSNPSPKPAQDFSAYIPQIDTAKKYLKRTFSGSVFATVGAVLFGLPLWIQIALATLVLVIVVGGIVLFVRYYKDIFAFVTAMNTLRATQGADNPVLTADKTS